MIYPDGKAINSLSSYYKFKFGKKTVKLALNAGFSCPNRDGTLSRTGCIFCSEKGSGDFAGDAEKSITEQIESQKRLSALKWPDANYIAYFQAFTNTYAPYDVLYKKYMEAANNPGISGIAIATRPDCLPEDTLGLLAELNRKTYLSVELGLQTANEKTARLINRGYDNACFERAVKALDSYGIEVVAHVILGLPGETKADMLDTIRYISALPIKGVKLHLLYILKGTPLEKMYERGSFKAMEKDEYITTLREALELLPPGIVIHRLTGDAPRKDIVAPLWSLKKWEVLNALDREMKNLGSYQGKNASLC